MTGITTTSEKRLIVASGRAHPDLAREIVDVLGVDLVPMDAYDFANGEIYVRFGESVRGCDAFVIQSHTSPINHWLTCWTMDCTTKASQPRTDSWYRMKISPLAKS